MKIIKRLILGVLINTVCLWTAALLIPGFSYSQQYILPVAALVLVVLDRTLKPLLKIIFLPINLLTLGLFSWVISALIVYTLSLLIDQIIINPFTFSGLSKYGFVIPSLYLNQAFVVIIAALTIRCTNAFLYWLIK